MSRLELGERGFSIVECIVAIGIVTLLGAIGWLVYRERTADSPNTSAGVVNNGSTIIADSYDGWQTYVTGGNGDYPGAYFRYPASWTASGGRGQSAVADATSSAFTSSAVDTQANPGASIQLYLQLSNDSLTIGCADTTCQVVGAAKLSNSELPGDVLAVVDQSSVNGTKYTEYVVASGETKIGDTSIKAVKTLSSGVYVFGQPFYNPENGGLTEAARVTDVNSFQANIHFQELVKIINSIVPNRIQAM